MVDGVEVRALQLHVLLRHGIEAHKRQCHSLQRLDLNRHVVQH